MNITTQKQQGSSLIEMMVALFVLAIGMLGVMSMQVKSMQFNQSAYYYGQAVYLANEIVESMRGNSAVAHSYLIELDEVKPNPQADCREAGVICSPTQLRDWDLSRWRENVSETLVSGTSSITNNGSFYTITVQFDDSRSDPNGAEGTVLGEYVLVTEIN